MTNIELFQSVRRDELDQFRRLLEDADLAMVTEGKRNLLHVAIAYRKPHHARELILCGIDINWHDANGETPLHYAAIHNQLETARLILEHGGNLSLTDKHGNTPLWCAAFNARGNYETVTLFLQKGAEANNKNKHGRSPLDFAQQIEDRKLIDMLSTK